MNKRRMWELIAFLMIVAVMDMGIGTALPAPAAILLPIVAVVFNVIFFNLTALRGNFARNGEKISYTKHH